MNRQINPVFRRGIQTRMRGARAPILMTVYFVILLGIYTMVYAVMSDASSYSGNARPRSEGSELLVVLYVLLIIMVYVIIALMVPAMNAGNIASEREKQTLDLLLCSPMSAFQIIIGKLLSNLMFILFLLVLTLPLFTVTYLLGNILIRDILLVFLYMAITAYGCASIATFFSALVKKTTVATILSYVTMILFNVATAIIGAFEMSSDWARNVYTSGTFVPASWMINPCFAVFELVARVGSNTGYSSMADMLESLPVPFILISSIFIIVVSLLLNISSAILIKPVQKFQTQR